MRDQIVTTCAGVVLWSALAAHAAAQTTVRLSRTSAGAQASGHCTLPAVSADARFVSFQSEATNLVPGDTNNVADVFVHDRALGVTRRVSVSSGGAQGDLLSEGPAAVSADGRFVTFASRATNLVPGDTNSERDCFVHDLQTGQTTRASVSSQGSQANGYCYNGALSADGRFVAFSSDATNLVQDDANDARDAFVHDRLTGATERVTVSSDETEGDNGGTAIAISADGRFVAIQSSSTNLVPDDTNARSDMFVRDRLLGVTTRVSLSTLGAEPDAHCRSEAMTPDGRFFVFSTAATNLVPGDTNERDDVFVRDRATGQTTRVSVATGGVQSNGISQFASISGNGRYVAFDSFASNLDPRDTDTRRDTFVHDRETGGTALVNLAWNDARGNHASFFPAVSADGFYIAFMARATNLVPSDTNNADDIFLRNLQPIIPPTPFPAGDQPAAVTIADFDADALGRPDLAVVNAGADSVTILLNNGTPGAEPSFAPPTPALTFAVGTQPRAVAAGDIDGDGDPDLAVANGGDEVCSILLNSGAGIFLPAAPVSAPGAPRGIALADLDSDSLPDLVITRRDAGLVSVFRNLGGGAFAPDQPQSPPGGQPGRPSGVGSGDLDNDKDIDVVASLDMTGQIVVFLNSSSTAGVIAFAPPQSFGVGGPMLRPVSVSVRDFDGDGALDIATANAADASVSVLRNLGAAGGVWLGLAAPATFAVGPTPVSVDANDVFASGLSDLFVASAFTDSNNQSSISVLRNVSTGAGVIAFEPEIRIPVPPLAAHVASGDVNLDGRVDVALASGFDAASEADSTRDAPTAGAVDVFAGASVTVALPPCDGDVSGDRVVDFVDLNVVLSIYGQTGPALPGDLNADGVVDFLDLNIVLSEFGSAC